MALAEEMRDRIRLEHYVEGPENVGHHFEHVVTVWAAAEFQGDARVRFRIRFRDDLHKKDDLEPAMRAIHEGTVFILDDVVETVRGVEVQLFAHREIIDELNHLATGTRRIKSWP